MQQAYCRYNGGDYSTGQCCCLDGWTRPVYEEVDAAIEALVAAGRELSIAALREAGVAEENLGRVIVIEFGSPASVFDLIAPYGYSVGGRWVGEDDETFRRLFD